MLSPGFLGDHSFLGLARLELCKSLSLWLRASQVPGTSYLPSHISLHIFQEDPRSNFSFIDFSDGPDLVGSMVGSVTIFLEYKFNTRSCVQLHSGFENSRKQAFETLKASPVNFEGRNSLVESEVTSRRLGKMAGKGSIGAQGCSFQRLKRLRQRLSVRVEARCDLSRQSGGDSKLVGSNFRALPCEASALSATFGRFSYSATGHLGRQRQVTCLSG